MREGLASGDLLLNLFVAARFPQEAELAARVTAESGCTSFALTVNESRADAAVGDGPHMLAGPPYLRERLAGVDLRVPATAFLQTNSAMCEVLYDTALRFAAPEPARPSVDLYCGIGSLSLPLARASREVHAIEIQEEAIDAARVNAELNGVGNASFYAADVRPLLRFPPHPVLDAGRADDADRPAVVIADPPRAGLARKALQRAAALGRRPLRLRLVQPHHAGRQRRRARGARLPPHRGRAGRHVPAHAPHRDGGAVRARGLTARRPPAAGAARTERLGRREPARLRPARPLPRRARRARSGRR